MNWDRMARWMLVLFVAWCGVGCARIGLRRTLEDYSQPITYSPTDPWRRGTVFQQHTGHAGWFYNCDCEEQKRFNPYICWKTQNNRERLPNYSREVRKDWREVKGRIRDGACMRGVACGICAGNVSTIQFCEGEPFVHPNSAAMRTAVAAKSTARVFEPMTSLPIPHSISRTLEDMPIEQEVLQSEFESTPHVDSASLPEQHGSKLDSAPHVRRR